MNCNLNFVNNNRVQTCREKRRGNIFRGDKIIIIQNRKLCGYKVYEK